MKSGFQNLIDIFLEITHLKKIINVEHLPSKAAIEYGVAGLNKSIVESKKSVGLSAVSELGSTERVKNKSYAKKFYAIFCFQTILILKF